MLFAIALIALVLIVAFPANALALAINFALLQETTAVIHPRGATAGWSAPWWVWLVMLLIAAAMVYVTWKGWRGRGNP